MNPAQWYKHYSEAIHLAWVEKRLEDWLEVGENNIELKLTAQEETNWIVRTGLHLLMIWAAASLLGFLQLIPFLDNSVIFSFLLAILLTALAWWGTWKKKWKVRGGIDEGLLTASMMFVGQGVFQWIGTQNLGNAESWGFALLLLTFWSYVTSMSAHAAILAIGWIMWFWWRYPEFFIAVPILLTICFLLIIWLNRINSWPHHGKAFWLEGWEQAASLAGPFIPLAGILVDESAISFWPMVIVVPILWGWLAWKQRSLEQLVYAFAGLIAGFSWLNSHFVWMAWDLWSMLISGIALVGLLLLLFRLKRGPWCWLSQNEEAHPELTAVLSMMIAENHQPSSIENQLFKGGETGGGGATSDY